MSDIDTNQQSDPAAVKPTPGLDRRTVLGAAGLVGVGLVVAACGSSSSGSTPTPSSTRQPGGSSTPSSSGTVLGSTMAIPVGGGMIYANQQVVVTQPTSGKYVGFSAVCPHQGCIMAGLTQGLIVCPCHGSTFSITDGAVTQGPSPTGLPPVKIKVVGTDVVLEA